MEGQLWQFLGSLIAVTALVGLAHWLGFSRTGRLADKEEAALVARLTPGGFDPLDIAMDTGGRGALCRDEAGKLVLVAPHGGQLIPHRIARGTAPHINDKCVSLTLPSGRTIELELSISVADWFSDAEPRDGACA